MLQPHEFHDNQQRTWRLEFTVGLAKRIRRLTSLDFVNAADGKALRAIAFDDEKLVQVLWLLCAEQCEAAGVVEEAFGMGLAGDQLGDAILALQEALVSFSRPDKRPAMQAILDRARKAQQKAVELVVQKVNSPAMDQALDREIKKAGDKIDEQLATDGSS